MQTASGQAVTDNSGRGGRATAARKRRRFGLSTPTLVIAALLGALSIGVMLLALLGIWPPPVHNERETIQQTWQKMRTATPAAQHAAGLKIEKLGAPTQKDGNVVVRLKVTNNVKIPVAPASGGAANSGALQDANINLASIVVVFYNEVNGEQDVTGSGVGNVSGLKFGESREIEVRATPVRDFSPATKYEAFSEMVWTDKDPVKKDNSGSGGGAPATPAASP